VPLRAHQLLERLPDCLTRQQKTALIQFTREKRASQRRTVIEYQYPSIALPHPVTIPHFTALLSAAMEQFLHHVFKMDGNQVPGLTILSITLKW
jgi:hypothetical protein